MVRDQQEMTPDEAVKAAKEKIRSSAKKVSEEMNTAVNGAQSKLLETVDGLQERVVKTADGLQERVVKTADGLQERVVKTADGLHQRVSQTVNHTQDRVLKTVDEVQGRVHDTADTLNKSVLEAKSGLQESAQHFGKQLHKPLEMAQQKPLESLAVAALAGWVVGLLTNGSPKPASRRKLPRSQQLTHKKPDLAVAASFTDQFGDFDSAPPPKTQPNAVGQAPAALTALAATGVGKMIWDAVREEYLTPQNVRGFIRGLFKPDPRVSK
jgi:ElaB/YqjD/DUF883 family membrane-anchored ribosome-binding protein